MKKQIPCENELCIYEKNNYCVLDNITVNAYGMCDCCIMVDIEKGFLNAQKEKQLNHENRKF